MRCQGPSGAGWRTSWPRWRSPWQRSERGCARGSSSRAQAGSRAQARSTIAAAVRSGAWAGQGPVAAGAVARVPSGAGGAGRGRAGTVLRRAGVRGCAGRGGGQCRAQRRYGAGRVRRSRHRRQGARQPVRRYRVQPGDQVPRLPPRRRLRGVGRHRGPVRPAAHVPALDGSCQPAERRQQGAREQRVRGHPQPDGEGGGVEPRGVRLEYGAPAAYDGHVRAVDDHRGLACPPAQLRQPVDEACAHRLILGPVPRRPA